MPHWPWPASGSLVGVNLKAAEQEFQQRLQGLDDDSRACAVFAYTEYTLWHVAGYDFEVQGALNQHKGFWWPVIAALHQSAFVALGRVFDDDRRTHNVRDLLKHAERYPGIFSRQALEDRKVKDGLDPMIAKQYAASAFEPRSNGFDQLRSAFEEKQRFYRARIDPIRDKLFAHSQILPEGGRDALFAKLMLRDMEQIFVFPLQLYRALFDLFQNGREPVIPAAATIITDVMKALPVEPGTSTWEHLHAAAYAKEFLDWLKSVADRAMK
jgi:hypothetical protein